jgi:hypothetical protein
MNGLGRSAVGVRHSLLVTVAVIAAGVFVRLYRHDAQSRQPTADIAGESQNTNQDPSLQILLTAYSAERQDYASKGSTIATFVGFALTYLTGTIVLLSSSSIRTDLSPGIILAVPSIPVVLFARISLLVADAHLHRRYLLELEEQVRARHRPDYSLPILEMPGWMAANGRVFLPGRRPAVRLMLSAAIITAFGGTAALLVSMVSYVSFLLPAGYRPWMLVLYGPAVLISLVVFLTSGFWVHRLLEARRREADDDVGVPGRGGL